MAFIINQGFSLKSPQFNFERDYYADMTALLKESYDNFPDKFITNVGGTLYQLTKTNAVDTNTGKWRLLKVAPNSVYTHPAGSAASKASGFYKFSTDGTSHISAVTAVTKADITALGIPSADTHWTTKLVAAATSTGNANATATNNNVHLNLFDNTTLRNNINIVGTGGTTVTSSVNGTSGKITINSPKYSNATPTATGLMSADDKKKLDALSVDETSMNNFEVGLVVKEDGLDYKTVLGADNMTIGHANTDGSIANIFEVMDGSLKVSEVVESSGKFSVKNTTAITGTSVTTTTLNASAIKKSGGTADTVFTTNGGTMQIQSIPKDTITSMF